jgi:creatinine amidohydrolase
MAYVAMAELTWPEAEALRGRRALGLLPTGSLEQHGPQLPLATDSLIAAELGRRVAESFVEPVVVAPVLPGGLSAHHLGFPGSVTLPEEVFGGAITAYVEAFERMGIRDVAVFSAHGGNFAFLAAYAAARAETGTGTRLVAYADFDAYATAMFEGARRGGVDAPPTDVHAGAIETSQGLALFPELVRPYGGVDGYTAQEEGWLDRMHAEGMRAVSPSGVLGDPPLARAEAGEPIFEAIAAELVRWIADELGYEPAVGSGSR